MILGGLLSDRKPSLAQSFLAILSPLLAHAILDIVIDDEVEFFICETVAVRQEVVDFVNYWFEIMNLYFWRLIALSFLK